MSFWLLSIAEMFGMDKVWQNVQDLANFIALTADYPMAKLFC